MIVRILSFLLILPVLFYKKCISPFLPHVCRFEPSCSTYMILAIKKYGPVKGLWKGIWRILRCNPWTPGGYDPP